MNHTDLVKSIAARGIATQEQADAVLRVALENVSEALRTGKEVSLLKVGKLKTFTKAAHTGRNPRTGAPVDVPAKTKVKFTASSSLVL